MTVSGIPNIRVIIREPDDENLLLDVPNINVRVIQDESYNVNITPPVTVTIRSGSYNRFADVALLAYTASYASGSGIIASFATSASYALTASYAENLPQDFSGNVTITGSLDVTDTVTADKVSGNQYKLTAGNVSLTFTGSINSGLFGVTEDVLPYISTIDYSGTTIEYIAQRTDAIRIGMILATWLNDEVVFTDVSTADVGNTEDISFAFIKSGSLFKLRVNSSGSGSGTWTVQSLFKLFPNLNP